MVQILNKKITSYIHHDQSGFILTRQLSDVRKSLNIINFCTTTHTRTVIMTLDDEKAFDRLETSYLIKLLHHTNFGPYFIRTMTALYKKTKTQLLVNNLRSDNFALTSRTCQGCPLSPILFALSLEPLAETIHQELQVYILALTIMWLASLLMTQCYIFLILFTHSHILWHWLTALMIFPDLPSMWHM